MVGMSFTGLAVIFLLAGNVAVIEANNCWKISATIHYSVRPSDVTVTQSDAENVVNEVLNYGKSQLSCSGLTMILLGVTIATPSNQYTITGDFGIIYGSMSSAQKTSAKSCLVNAQVFNDIVRRPDYYINPLKGTYFADRVTLSSLQDSTCIVNGSLSSSVVPATAFTVLPTSSTASQQQLNITTVSPSTSVTPSSSAVMYPTTGLSHNITQVPTLPPTTQLPTTQFPTTQLPTTQFPTTQLPTTQLPTTQFPTTQLPTTQLPTTASAFYPLLKCYTLDFVAFYNASWPKSSNSTFSILPQAKPMINQLFQRASNLLPRIDGCQSVQVSLLKIMFDLRRSSGWIHLSSITIRGKFTTSGIPDEEVAGRLSGCLAAIQKPYYSILLNTWVTLPLTVMGVDYHQHNITMTRPMSCCGGPAKPPCCHGNDIKQSPSSCAYLGFIDFSPDKQADLGARVVLSCAFTTTATSVKIEWTREDGRNLPADSFPSKNGTLTIPKAETVDAGHYTCAISNSYQLVPISKDLKLKIIVSKQVEMQMGLKNEEFDQDLRNTSSAKFLALSKDFEKQGAAVFAKLVKGFERIKATGFTEGSVIVDFIIYILQVISTPQPSPPDIVKEVNAIMIKQVKTGSFGNYSVSIDSLFLKVLPPPPTNIKSKDRGIMYIEIQWDPPSNSLSYRINTYFIKYKKREEAEFKEIEVDSSTSSKKITELKKNTKYEFQLRSSSIIGKSSWSPLFIITTLSVNPIIANNEQIFIFEEGQKAVIFCTGSSDPKPEKVEWTTERPLLAHKNHNDTQKSRTIYMTFDKVKVENAGIYECKASFKDVTGKGSVALVVTVPVKVEMNATLVNETFTEELKNRSSPEYKKLENRFVTVLTEIYKNVTGFERVEVTGFTNGSVKVGFRVIARVRIEEAKQSSKPTEAKVQYTAIIIQKVKTTGGDLGGGVIIKENSIQTNAPPPSPRNLTVTEVHETMAHIRWQEPEGAYAFSIQSYIIKLKKFGHSWDDKGSVKHIQLDKRLDELEDDTRYTVKVFAIGNGGDGLHSKTQEFQTKEDVVDLTWLWVCLALLLVVGILGFIVHNYRKRVNADRRYDANGNRVGRRTSIQFSGGDKNVTIHSYRNDAFALNALDFESIEMMPGKWWEIPRALLTLENNLGSGAFGMVKKGVLHLDNGPLTCAVKMLKNSAGDEEARDLINELEIMAGVGVHVNLVNLIGACTYEGPLLIVLEFAEGGSLLSYIKDNVTLTDEGFEASSLPNEEKLQIALDIATGMQHLARVKCVHRDLAARNVLLAGDHKAKIADFGLSRDVYERGFYEKQSQGKLPVRWMSPEAIQQMIFTTKGDVWSFGVVLWEIESGGKLPYGGLGMLELIEHLKKGKRLPRPDRCTEAIYNVMLHCWNMDPSRRPDFDNLCANVEELFSQPTVPQVTEAPYPRYELHPHFEHQ